MKKVSLITIFDNPNFGTYLQALALTLVLERHGVKVEIIRYKRKCLFPKSRLRKWTPFLDPIRLIRDFLFPNKWINQIKLCHKFISQYVSLTKQYSSYSELEKDPPKADIYLTGSDQVWNTSHNHGIDKAFYLAFAPKNAPKLAYAASIGMSEIPEQYKAETKQLLDEYDCITVREKNAVDLLKQIGISAKEVLDPTLLLDRNEWTKYAAPRIVKEPYLLVYSVESKERDFIISRIARKIAQKKGLKVVEVSYTGTSKEIPDCDSHIYYASPDMFLSAILHSSYVVVSSFHGTAFSINFNKNFVTVAPDRFSSRIDSLLEKTNLINRKVCSEENLDESFFSEDIDFSEANAVLQKERAESMLFFDSMPR